VLAIVGTTMKENGEAVMKERVFTFQKNFAF
jgi:hypothetical protein